MPSYSSRLPFITSKFQGRKMPDSECKELSDAAAGVALRNGWRRQATVGELSLEASSRSCSRGTVQPCSTVQPGTVTARVVL
jgi:hypothetical protein